MPPTVQNLQDIIGQITAAQAPEQSQIDQNISNNETSGAGQVAGLDAAKTNAFNTIEQNAQNKGMYFSGFSPNAQATYTGSTYLPALAKLQATIANTRNTLLGQKANLVTQANTQALTTQQGEQKELDAYNSQQASLAQQRQLQAEAEAATARENAANRAATVSAASAKAAASGPPSLQTGLQQLFTGYVPAAKGGTPFYTENTIIPQIESAYGLSKAAASNAVYQYRKAQFGE